MCDEEPTFYCVDVVTPFHLASALACALSINPRGGRVVAMVIPSPEGDYLLEPGKYSCDGLAIEIRVQVPVASDLRAIARHMVGRISRWRRGGSSSREVWLLHHTYFKPTALAHVPVELRADVSVGTFEEGTGTHAGVRSHIRAARAEGRRFPVAKFLLKRFLSCARFVDWQYYHLDGGNQAVLSRAFAVLARTIYADAVRSATRTLVGGEERVVIAGSPLCATGVVSPERYREVLEEIASQFDEARIAVKPHPRETDLSVYRQLGLDVLPRGVPGEILLEALAPVTIVGFRTGLLLASAKIPGVTAVDFGDVLLRDVPGWLLQDSVVKGLSEAAGVVRRMPGSERAL